MKTIFAVLLFIGLATSAMAAPLFYKGLKTSNQNFPGGVTVVETCEQKDSSARSVLPEFSNMTFYCCGMVIETGCLSGMVKLLGSICRTLKPDYNLATSALTVCNNVGSPSVSCGEEPLTPVGIDQDPPTAQELRAKVDALVADIRQEKGDITAVLTQASQLCPH